MEAFKKTLRNEVSADRLNVLKPLTPEEVKAILADGPSSEQMELMKAELKKINDFIAAYGDENANLGRRDELINALISNKTRSSAIKKINDEIEKGINFITDQTGLTLSKYGTDKDKFLYTVLKNFDPSVKYPCGLSGSVEQRIEDCSNIESSVSGSFVLVTRTKEFKEVKKDTKSGLLWGDRLPTTMNNYDAMKACKADLAEVGGVVSGTWRLPTMEEYIEANINGIKSALPNMNSLWWSSSVDRSSDEIAWLFDDINGEVYDGFRDDDDGYSVRCVAR